FRRMSGATIVFYLLSLATGAAALLIGVDGCIEAFTEITAPTKIDESGAMIGLALISILSVGCGIALLVVATMVVYKFLKYHLWQYPENWRRLSRIWVTVFACSVLFMFFFCAIWFYIEFYVLDILA